MLTEPNAGHLADTVVLLMQLSDSPFRTVVEVRSAVEPMIAWLSATVVREQTLRELRATVDTMRHVPLGDPSYWAADKRFHRVVASSSDNPLLALVVDSLLGIMDGDAAGIGYPEARRDEILRAHVGIIEALTAHDPDAASARMLAHIKDYETYAERAFPELPGQTVTWEPRPLV